MNSAASTWLPVSQVISRNLSVFEASSSLLVVNAPEIGVWQQWSADTVLHFFSQDFRVHSELQQAGFQSHFAAVANELPDNADVLLYWPKSKELARMLLSMLLSLMDAGRQLWIVGEHQEGVKSAAKILLEDHEIELSKLDNARRCTLYRVTVDRAFPVFDIETWLHYSSVVLDDTELQVVSLPGVFSLGELDEGTALLLPNMKLPELGRVLDFGCGAGIIGAVAKRRKPQLDVELIDVSALALESARRTLAQNGIEALVYPSNAWSDIEGRFKVVLSNPPFHTGIKTDYRAVTELIAQARKKIVYDGWLEVVANAHLPYEGWLQEQFKRVAVVAETTKFKVYSARG